MFTNCLQLVNHTSDSSLPIKVKSSDGLPAEVLTGRFIKLSAVLRQFKRTHFATERSRYSVIVSEFSIQIFYPLNLLASLY